MAGIVTDDSLRPGGSPVDTEIVRHSHAGVPPLELSDCLPKLRDSR